MGDWNRQVILLAIFAVSSFASYQPVDNVQRLPFCNPNDASVNNDVVIVSTLDGRLTAFTTENGIKMWHVDTTPLLSSNLHHVELTAGGKWVRLVPSLRGTLYSLSGENVEPLPFDSEQLLSSSFKYSDDLVIAGARETLWLGVDANTGTVMYECGSAGCNSEQQTAGSGRDVIVLRRHSNTVRALDPRSGTEKWNFSVAEHQLALSRRECAGANPGPAGGFAVSIGVALPEGVVAIRRPGELHPMWQQKLDAPIASMWRLQGGSLHTIDVLWEATQSLVKNEVVAPPSLYIGVHNRQLYIQEGMLYASKLETSVSSKPAPWKLMNSRPLINGGDTAISPLQDSEPNTLSLITLHGNTGQIGDHGFFLYLQETCEQAVQVSDDSDDAEGVIPNSSDDQEHHHIHVHVYSLWFWWKEVIVIAISSAVLMNLIWPRFFAPKIRLPTPLPINKEYIVVERHLPPVGGNVNSGRYDSDFTPLKCLGRGGFGVVFEARNNIDYCSYAVKRITLPNKESKRERVLREVRVLAKLDHEHIVRYFNAWVEVPPPMCQEQRDAAWLRDLEGVSTISEDYTTSQVPVKTPPKADSVLLNIQKSLDDGLDYEKQLTETKRNRSQSFNDSFSIVFDENASGHYSETSVKAKKDTNNRSAGLSNSLSKHAASGDRGDSFVMSQGTDINTSDVNKASIDKRLEWVKDIHKTDNYSKKQKGHTRHWSLDMCVSRESPRPLRGSKVYLYIQMQLCRKDSLHDWLRQNRDWESRGDKVKQLFRQIVSAVEYVHLAGLIHRDLKPSNILFALDGRVKVGDFGLVTAITEGSRDGQPTQIGQEHVHTNKVGTHLYMSPEQLMGRPYGYKVDIYSLGLILFELLHPFGTESERVACLRGVRNGIYPSKFQEIHPEEMEVLKLMLSDDPELRPSATGIRARAPLYEVTDERWHFTLPNLSTA